MGWTQACHNKPESEHTGYPVTKKFQIQRSLKKVMLPVFWAIKRLITIDFLEKKMQLLEVHPFANSLGKSHLIY